MFANNSSLGRAGKGNLGPPYQGSSHYLHDAEMATNLVKLLALG